MEPALLGQNALAFLLRWTHLLAGIAWLGLLYYFNFIQGEYFKTADSGAKSDVIQKLMPNALRWFRWGAVVTLLSGILLLSVKHLTGMGIMIGAALGTIMFLNVWLVIWPNQKIVIASAKQLAIGGEALPGAAGALGKAWLASRTNTLFSIPMLFFMASSVHLPQIQTPLQNQSAASLAAVFGLIAVLALNGVIGKAGPLNSIKGVIGGGFVLTAILYLMVDFL